MTEKITKREQDYSRWYTDIVLRAELADYGPVRGCMVIRPNGYGIWELMRNELDRRFKETGHSNTYFPLFVPKSFLEKEAEHIEGFAPECAVVTEAGGEQLEEPLVVRPTSEAMIWHMYKKWISSHRDLPLLYNQWANVVRWEMRTRLFLRTTEFLWQEGHTAHASEQEAREEATRMIDLYRDFAENFLAVPAICGYKTANERFAGAVETYTLEAMMQDRKALQLCTSHYLGEKFARAFEVQFQSEEGDLRYPHATSWGITTRCIGALIMTHSDNQGLILPPKVAPTQVVIVPIWRSEEDQATIRSFVENLMEELKECCRIHFDGREEIKPGRKFNEWELKGVPVRMEIGPRDLANQQAVLVRRDTGEKRAVALANIKDEIQRLFSEIQLNLLIRAQQWRDDSSHQIDSFEQFETVLNEEGGFLYAHWCGETDCEKRIAEETKATIRCIPVDSPLEQGSCVRCGNSSERRVLFARSY